MPCLRSLHFAFTTSSTAFLAASTLLTLGACGDEPTMMTGAGSDTGTGTDSSTDVGDSSTGDTTEGSADDESTSGGPEEAGPLYAVVTAWSANLPVVQIADISDPEVEPTLVTVQERPNPADRIRNALVTDTWSAYPVGQDLDYRLMLHDLVNAPMGPMVEVQGLGVGQIELHMDHARSLLTVAVDDGVNMPGYLVHLDGDPTVATPVEGAPSRVHLRLSPDGAWLWGFGDDQSYAGQIYAAPIVDGLADPLTELSSFPYGLGAGPALVVTEDQAIVRAGDWATGLYLADVSAWPTAEITEIFPPDPTQSFQWDVSPRGTHAVRLSSDIDFQYNGELATIVDGVPQAPVPINAPPDSIHETYFTDDGAFLFMNVAAGAGLDDIMVAWLDGPDPASPQVLSTARFQLLDNDPLVLLDGWAVWQAGVGGLQAASIDGDTIGAVQQISPELELISSLWVSNEHVVYTLEDPMGEHIPQRLWLIDMSGDTPGEPIPATPPLAEGVSGTSTFATPSNDQLFYMTFEASPGAASIRGMWRWRPDMDGSETLLMEHPTGWGFHLATPPPV